MVLVVCSVHYIHIISIGLQILQSNAFETGKAANTAVACAYMGASSSFIGAFGDDNNTEMLESEMGKNGVNTKTCYKLTDSKIPCGQAVE